MYSIALPCNIHITPNALDDAKLRNFIVTTMSIGGENAAKR